MHPSGYRRQLYDVFADASEGVDAKVERALALGTTYLDLPIGFLSRIDGKRQEIVQATGDHSLLQAGESCRLAEAYCRRTVGLESPLAVQDAAGSPAVSDVARETFGLGTYVGARILVDGEVYGTVCFADRDARTDPFADAETHFVELLATLLGRELEQRAFERELAERESALHEREEIYRAVVEANFDLVFRIDTAGEFIFVSNAVEEFLGNPPEDYVGRPFTAVLPDEETVELGTDLFEQVLAGETVEQEYFRLESTRGDVVVDLRATPIYRGDVQPGDRTAADVVAIQGMARDATERLERERLVRVLNRVLRHNLRNDMNVVGGFAELLADRLTGDDARKAERIVETSERLMSLTETARKLELNLESSPELARLDVVPVVRRAASQVAERYPDATVTVDAPAAAAARSAPRLETALWELLDNAAKHAGDDAAVGVEVATSDETVLVRVTDDGTGLPDQERAVLTTGEETELVHGSGLGLWLVYWIVESLDGDLRVRDTDVGTRIEIRLPAAPNPTERR